MNFIETPLKGLYLIEPELIKDDRGFFTRIYCKKQFLTIGFEKDFVQFNHSFNIKKGTIRGLHYQKPPFAETKLIRCIEGGVFDVAVDLRKNSPTYLKSFGVELSSLNKLCILIPEGFAHGFQTLANDTSLLYHHSDFHSSNSEGGIRFDDPELNINWPLSVNNISTRDLSYTHINKNFEPISL